LFLGSLLFALSVLPAESCLPAPILGLGFALSGNEIPVTRDDIGVALKGELEDLGITGTLMDWAAPSSDGFFVRVQIVAKMPARWNLAESSLGAVHKTLDGPSPVFVFYPSVVRVLGFPGKSEKLTGPPLPVSKWIRGLARIILHEILHVLLPESPHDETGIFAENLEPRDLTARTLNLQENTRAKLLDRLCSARAR
jgi:hypothetical protein